MSNGAVFVTGGTGFIGSHLIVGLLERGFRVIALARDGSGRPVRERMVGALERAHGGPLSQRMEARLEALRGDLVMPGLGLDRPTRDRVAEETEQICHCGGDVRFYPGDRAAFRAVHLDGPVNVLRAIGAGGRQRFCHVSTAYVAGRRAGTAYESELDVGQGFRNPYEQIKCRAEKNLREVCGDLGVHLVVLRPSIVVADPSVRRMRWSDPVSTRFEAFVRCWRSYRRRAAAPGFALRIRGAGDSHLNIVPVTYVVDAMLEFAARAGHPGRVYHLVDPSPPSNFELVDRIMRDLGIPGVRPFEHRRLPMEQMTAFENRIDRLLRPYRDYFFESPRFDDRNAREFLGDRVAPRSGTAFGLFSRFAHEYGAHAMPGASSLT